MVKNCLTCSKRIKSKASWDENGGDFWHCTAVVPVQGFGIMWLENRNLNPADPYAVGRLTNLNNFIKDHKHYKAGVENRDCALWETRNEM